MSRRGDDQREWVSQYQVRRDERDGCREKKLQERVIVEESSCNIDGDRYGFQGT